MTLPCISLKLLNARTKINPNPSIAAHRFKVIYLPSILHKIYCILRKQRGGYYNEFAKETKIPIVIAAEPHFGLSYRGKRSFNDRNNRGWPNENLSMLCNRRILAKHRRADAKAQDRINSRRLSNFASLCKRICRNTRKGIRSISCIQGRELTSAAFSFFHRVL